MLFTRHQLHVLGGDTGVIFGQFNKSRAADYTMNLKAVDLRGQTAVLETYTFRVQLPQEFAVKIGWLRTGGLHGGGYGPEKGAGAPPTYYRGSTYDFPPIDTDEWPVGRLFANYQGEGEKITYSMAFCHREKQGGACQHDRSAALDELDVLVGKDGKASVA